MSAATASGTISDVTDSNDPDNVRERRERIGVSQRGLAAEAGVSENTVASVERGKTAHKRGVVLAALERLEARGGRPTPQPEPDSRNLRALSAQVPKDQAVIAVERVRDLSRPGMTVYTVVAADDETDDDALRRALEELHRRLDTDQ